MPARPSLADLTLRRATRLIARRSTAGLAARLGPWRGALASAPRRAFARRAGVAVAAFGALLLAAQACGRGGGAGPAADAATPLPPVASSRDVVAEGVVVPVRRAELSFAAGGAVERVSVAVGDAVAAGEELVRLDGADVAARVLQARADLSAAEAELARLTDGASDEEVAAAEAAVAAAEAGARAAGGAVAGARAALDKLTAGADSPDVAVALRRVRAAENALWGAQARRDSICGEAKKKHVAQAECDAAEAEVGRLYEEGRVAQIEVDRLLAGARPEDVAAARAGVGQAGGRYDAAQADVARARAELERVRRGAGEAALAAARARVDQARAGLEAAEVAMDRTVLRAPFRGVLASVGAREGEQLAPGAIAARVGDTSAWRVVTDDLTELGIVDIRVGDPATLTIDALPEVDLEGEVSRVGGFGTDRLGDVVYEVEITPTRHEPRLRWGMTASVVITPRGE